MTFEEAIDLNRKELARQWATRRGDLVEVLGSLKLTISRVEAQMNEPIPECGLYEIYLGYGGELQGRSEEAIKAYRGLESVKQRSKFIEDLKSAVS